MVIFNKVSVRNIHCGVDLYFCVLNNVSQLFRRFEMIIIFVSHDVLICGIVA